MLRFHLDEHIDPAIADGLRRRGIDVTGAAGAGLRSIGQLLRSLILLIDCLGPEAMRNHVEFL